MCVYPHISISLYFTAQRKGYNSVSEKMNSFARCTTGAVEKTPDSILQRSTHSTRLNCLINEVHSECQWAGLSCLEVYGPIR